MSKCIKIVQKFNAGDILNSLLQVVKIQGFPHSISLAQMPKSCFVENASETLGSQELQL